MKKYIAMTATALTVFLTLRAVSVKWSTPDFSFPDKVAREAAEHLDSAMAVKDNPATVRALMDYSLARAAVSTDYIPEAIARIDSVAVRSDSCTASLLYLLEADIYSDIYSRNRWRYDEREAPLEPLPTDPQAWTGEQFKHKIAELLDAATRPANALQRSPLSDWSAAISGSVTDYIFYPTLLDFVYTRAIEKYKNLGSSSVVPLRHVSLREALSPLPADITAKMPEYPRRARELNLQLIRLNANRPAPRILAEIALVQTSYYEDRIDLFLDLYEANADSEYGAEALLACDPRTIEQTKELVQYLRQAIARFPGYIRVDNLRQRLNELLDADASLIINGCFAPGIAKEVTLSGNNVRTARVLIYKTGDYTTPVIDRTFDIDSVLPNNVDTVLPLTLDKPGQYRSILLLNGQPIKDRQASIRRAPMLTCTAQLPLIVGMESYAAPYAVNSYSGAPLSGVKIISQYRPGDSRSLRKTELGLTTAEGTLASPLDNLKDGSYTFTFIHNGDSISTSWYGNPRETPDYDLTARTYTDLPLYHHGDTVQWAVVVYKDRYMKGVAAETKVGITISDPNGEEIYNETFMTDESGRIQGSTVLPAEGLSGSYSISVCASNTTVYVAYDNFEVNDYKLPTFKATANILSRSDNPDAAVTLECKAETYSGFPLVNASVNATLDYYSGYFYADETVWSVDTVLGADGTLRLSIPANVLESGNRKGRYGMRFSITSQSGETQFAVAYFTTGKPYYIMPVSSDRFVCTDKPFALLPEVKDAADNTVDIPLNVRITTADNKVLVNSTVADLKLSRIKPGKYNIIYSTADTALADPYKLNNVIFYSETGACPVEEPIWMPGSSGANFKVNDGTSYEFTYGSGIPDAYILAVESVDGLITSRRWIRPGSGMHRYKVNIPDGSHEITVSMFSVYNCQAYDRKATITNTRSYPGIKIAGESFRDKVVPGDKETITLAITDKEDNPVPANVILAMNSEAINRLAGTTGIYMPQPQLYFNAPTYRSYSAHKVAYAASHTNFKGNITYISQPAFVFYGQSFFPGGNRRYYKSRAMSNADGGVEDLAIVREYAEEPMAMMTGSVSGIITQEEEIEAVFDDAALNDVLVAGYGTAKKESDPGTDDFNYRPSEIPLAFFAPMLTTDSLGRLTYTYTVPEANTSWTLCTAVYTDRMLTANKQATIVASRPVMVQSNLPRFLRYGDVAQLKSLIMNNSDSAFTATTTVTLLDAATMQPVGSKEFTNLLKAKESATVSFQYETPNKGQALIYRVKTTAGCYSDGEQDIIPLLPATQPVTVSTPFFIPAPCCDSTIVLPSPGGNGTSTIYLYDNPIWEIITALPSLREDAPATSTAAAASLYSAATSQGLMKKYPAIKNALGEWIKSDRNDSTMTSMLERNDDLKQLAIKATPWVQEAMSDAERLDRLALLLDDSNTDKAIKTAIRTLGQLAQSDGGFAWCPGYGQTSEWATFNVLSTIAALKHRGLLPADKTLAKLIDDAMAYCDSVARDRYDRYGDKADYTEYVFLRSLLGYKSTYAPIVSATTRSILKNWKNEGVMLKARDAIVLHYNGYPTMARKLVASIVAYSISSPEKGMWWQGVDTGDAASLLTTFETVKPVDSNVIDAVAQWLILAKTSQTWGNSAVTAAAVDALLGAIPATQAVGAEATVTLNGTSLHTPGNGFPGMTVADVSGRLTSADNLLRIVKPTGLPAFGSLITRSVMALDSIPAHSHPSVSIAKRLNVTSGTDILAADTLKVGDRVNVQLVLTVKDRLDYVTIIDRNGACLEPVDQLSGYSSSDGLWYYREVTDTETRLYIDCLMPGTYLINYPVTVMASGQFSSGVATLQCQVNPSVDANSSARRLTVDE